MKVSVIGSGYVGLVTAACLADIGNDVLCFDVDSAKIDMILDGRLPLYEPGLAALVERNATAGRLRFTSDPVASAIHGHVQFIAVGTPPDEDGSADLKHVIAAARNIGRHMSGERIVAVKSTVPVGTSIRVRQAIDDELGQRGTPLVAHVVSNPEFLKEGAAVGDFTRPDRIVIGAQDEGAVAVLKELYGPYVRNHDRILVMDTASAELTKYAANAMLATRISFINELANLAETLGADIDAVRRGIGSDARIGYSFLYAGAGYGGSCFPKDVKALIRTGAENDHELAIVRAVEEVNDHQKTVLGRKVFKRFGESLKGRHLAVWGLAFKPNTDDVRESPSLALIAQLLQAGATVCAYDPVAVPGVRRQFGDSLGITFAGSALDACDAADAVIVVTEWREFCHPDFEALRSALRRPIIIDGRNIFDPSLPAGHGFEYISIGRPAREGRAGRRRHLS